MEKSILIILFIIFALFFLFITDIYFVCRKGKGKKLNKDKTEFWHTDENNN